MKYRLKNNDISILIIQIVHIIKVVHVEHLEHIVQEHDEVQNVDQRHLNPDSTYSTDRTYSAGTQ